MYEYCRVIYQSFGCIDMLSLCIYESFELLIVNVGYEYERVLWTWVWYECLPFLLYLCVNLLVCLLWGIKHRTLIKVMLCPIYVFPYNHIIYTSKRARALQREKIWHTLTFYSSLPGLSLHVLRCNNIINYQTALGVFFLRHHSENDWQYEHHQPEESCCCYDLHGQEDIWCALTSNNNVSHGFVFSEPVLYLIIWHKKVVILSLQLRPTWLVILPKDVAYDIFQKKECIISLLSSNWRKLNVKI